MPRTMNWPMLADDMNMTITVEVAEETWLGSELGIGIGLGLGSELA